MIREVDGKIEGNISSIIPRIQGSITTTLPSIKANIISAENIPVYRGVVDIVPNELDQILETRRKIVTDDITIRGVPYAEVTNPSGGYTVTIG